MGGEEGEEGERKAEAELGTKHSRDRPPLAPGRACPGRRERGAMAGRKALRRRGRAAP